MKISVLTPTIRPEGLKIVEEALHNQQFDGKFEWIIGARSACPIINTPFITRWINDDFEGGFWALNRIYNKLFQEATGELVVSLQDNIYIPPDGLQKFWDAYEDTAGQALISGVGDQYEQLDENGKPIVKIWSDPRKTTKHGTFYECYWNDCEWNWAAIPRVKFFDVGGMDEQLDFAGYGGDQLQLCDRIDDMQTAKFYIDQENESFTLRHDRSAHGGQENWDKHHVLLNDAYVKRKNQLIREKNWPVLEDNGNLIKLNLHEQATTQ